MMLLSMIEYTLSACPEGIAISGAIINTHQLWPLGVCLSQGHGAEMLRCNDNHDGIELWTFTELNCTDVHPAHPEPQDVTSQFDNFTCDYIEDCNYIHIYSWGIDESEIETCESEEANAGFGGTNCQQTECGVPDPFGDAHIGITSTIFTDYPDAWSQSETFGINHCVEIMEMGPANTSLGWGLTETGL